MNLKQELLNCGINVFAIDLLCESYLKSPIVDVLEKPLVFEYPIMRGDCKKWAGVKITLEGIPR
jgi:hypothetical protein